MKTEITITPTDNDKFLVEFDTSPEMKQYAFDTICEVFERILSEYSGKSLSEVGVRVATRADEAIALKAWRYER
jgi:hypothetical protein